MPARCVLGLGQQKRAKVVPWPLYGAQNGPVRLVVVVVFGFVTVFASGSL